MAQYRNVKPEILAAELVQLFGRYLDHADEASGRTDRRGVAKHLVIIATRLHSVGRVDAHTALRLAARAYGEHFETPASTLKKCASEARALLAAREERGVQMTRLRRHFDAFAEIDSQLAVESPHAAAALRAARLSGRRGGRPPITGAVRPPKQEPALPPARIARAIVSLKERAGVGDESAKRVLEQLKRLISPQAF